MNRTFTPELAPDVLDRLARYTAGFRHDFNRPGFMRPSMCRAKSGGKNGIL